MRPEAILTIVLKEGHDSIELEAKETTLSLAMKHHKAAEDSLREGKCRELLVHAHAAEAAARSIPATKHYRGLHPLYLRAIELLAAGYETQGDRKKAFSYIHELHLHNPISIGPDHPFTLATTHGCAKLLANGGELARAQILLEDLMDAYRTRLSKHFTLEAHASFLESSSLLAQVKLRAGQHTHAMKLHVGNLASAVKVHGTQSLVTEAMMDALIGSAVSSYVCAVS